MWRERKPDDHGGNAVGNQTAVGGRPLNQYSKHPAGQCRVRGGFSLLQQVLQPDAVARIGAGLLLVLAAKAVEVALAYHE